jgi:dethiobiotin synthetase
MEIINPISLKIPAAPHIEANQIALVLNVNTVIEKVQPALKHASDVDVVLIEGVGGWYVPLNNTETMADVVKQLNMDVILVVGMRLGCLNHALLTVQAILNDNVKLTGWIANCVDPNMGFLDENIETLSKRIKAPLLGKVPFGGSVEECVDVGNL